MKEFMAVIKLRVKGSFWMSILIIIGSAVALAAIINIMMGTAMWQINGELSLMKTVESIGIKIYLPVTLLLLTLLWRKENGTTVKAPSHVNYVEDRLSISGKKSARGEMAFQWGHGVCGNCHAGSIVRSYSIYLSTKIRGCIGFFPRNSDTMC